MIIVSASPDIYLQAFAQKYNCELLCTRTAYQDSLYQEHFASPNCTKDEKVNRIRAHLGDLSAYEIHAYGNSSDDFAMLSLAQHAHFNDFKTGCLVHITRYLNLMRFHQYVKNCFVFIPIFFAGQFFELNLLLSTTACFLVFCLVASFIYILNDIRDLNEDRNHAIKRFRPIACGLVSPHEAYALAAVVIGLALLIALTTLPVAALSMIALYLLLHLSYVYALKYVALFDIVCVALGFNLRVFAGGFACGLVSSAWLVLMVFLLSMFLVMGKRWDDLARQEAQPNVVIRPALYGYNKEFALSSLTFFSAITSVCYVLYCLDHEVQERLGSSYVYISALWVMLGNLRYLQNIFVFKASLSPSKILYHDHVLQMCLVAWFITMLYFIYS